MLPRSMKWWNEAQPDDLPIKSWTGGLDQYCSYVSHLVAPNPHSVTTPVRIVWNSSQKYKGVIINNLLKGPDVLNIRERPAGCVTQVAIRETASLPNFVHLENERRLINVDTYVDDLLTSHDNT